MTLKEFVEALAHGERGKFRRMLAEAHGCSVATIRKWENYPAPPGWSEQKCKQMSRPHPATLDAIALTEKLTGGAVARYNLRPDVFRKED